MNNIQSHNNFLKRIEKADRSFLLLYKPESEASRCAIANLSSIAGKDSSIPVFYADVSAVRDIHSHYGVTSVPSLLIFNGQNLVNVIKGCQDASFYQALTDQAVFQMKAAAEGKAPKQVTVYSTPTCSWCNTLKGWLRKNGVPYTDIDVSRDERAAQDMVSRSGQQGVPQTEISGRIVVGFDQAKLKELLEIQ